MNDSTNWWYFQKKKKFRTKLSIKKSFNVNQNVKCQNNQKPLHGIKSKTARPNELSFTKNYKNICRSLKLGHYIIKIINKT